MFANARFSSTCGPGPAVYRGPPCNEYGDDRIAQLTVIPHHASRNDLLGAAPRALGVRAESGKSQGKVRHKSGAGLGLKA